MQNYKIIDHIIIDGNSRDGSSEIAMSYSGQTCKVISENDYGYYDALNKGVDMAKGEVIGILNADDFYVDPNILKIVATHFASDPDLDCIYGDLCFTERKNINKNVICKWSAGEFSRQKMNYGWMPPHPTIFFRRSVYEKIGRFDLQFKISSDYDLILRAFKDASFRSKYLPQVIAYMRVGGLSNRSWRNILTKISEDYVIMKKNGLPAPLLALIFKNISKWLQFKRIL